MTALCGGGASQAKSGFTPTVVMTTSGLAALLNNVPTPWAVPFAMLLAGVSYDLTTMCGTDPPALVAMTGADMVSLATPLADPIGYIAAVQKFYSFIKYWAWFQFCECAAIATPAPSAPPAAPANTPQLNPPVGTAPFALPCWDKLAVKQNGGTLVLQKNISAALLPAGVTRASSNPGIAGLEVKMPVPAPTHVSGIIHTNNEDPGGTMNFTLQFSNAAGGQTGQAAVATVANSDSGFEIDTPANSTYWEFGIDNNVGTGALTANIELKAYCGGNTPTTVAAPCCPPDPLASGMLAQVLALVTLVQRQLVPFAYIISTAHAGLSGQGSFAVQGLLGVRLDLTTVPSSVTQDASTPPFVYNVGWVSMSDANGFIDETRAHAVHQNWFSRIASEATLVGYSFAPGVVATITELQREP